MTAILDFAHTAMSKVLSGHTFFVGHTWQPYDRHTNHESRPYLYSVENDTYLLFDLAHMTIIFDLAAKHCLMYFIAALLCRAYLKSKL